jgi:hypothetical protein
VMYCCVDIDGRRMNWESSSTVPVLQAEDAHV